MKNVFRLIKFIISGTLLILCAILLAYTMIGFVYYYSHLKQDPMGYFSWWYGNVRSFNYMQYKYYFAAFEILLAISGIIYVWKDRKEHT
jgi:hypothetical protein